MNDVVLLGKEVLLERTSAMRNGKALLWWCECMHQQFMDPFHLELQNTTPCESGPCPQRSSSLSPHEANFPHTQQLHLSIPLKSMRHTFPSPKLQNHPCPRPQIPLSSQHLRANGNG